MPTRVLIVDDCPDMRVVFEQRFERAGAKVSTAACGATGIEAVRAAGAEKRPYDLVILDVRMPGMTGMSAAREMRDLGFNGLIVAFTASPSGSGRVEGAECGVDIYLDKSTLRAKVISALLDQAAAAATE